MFNIDFNHPIHVHFIGIGGISMSGLAGFFLTGTSLSQVLMHTNQSLQMNLQRMDVLYLIHSQQTISLVILTLSYTLLLSTLTTKNLKPLLLLVFLL